MALIFLSITYYRNTLSKLASTVWYIATGVYVHHGCVSVCLHNTLYACMCACACACQHEAWPSEAGRQGQLEPPHYWCLPFQHNIIMAYARTRMSTIGMQTAQKTAGTDSASSSI